MRMMSHMFRSKLEAAESLIIDRVLLQFPEYANVIKQPELSYESYDPSFGDHMNKALFNFTSMSFI